jgi:hypothetical protein
MLRLLPFHASYCTLHLMHCTILLLAHMALLPARPRIRGAEIRDSSGASPNGVWWSSSVKQEDTNITFEQGKPRCTPPTLLVHRVIASANLFYF